MPRVTLQKKTFHPIASSLRNKLIYEIILSSIILSEGGFKI